MRPRKQINQKQFENLCAIQCTKEEICSVLDVTEKTLNKWCKEVYDKTFSLVFNEKRQKGRISLRRNQWKLAEDGHPTMLVWMGKNYLKQSDNPLQDEIKLRELALKEREFELKEQLLRRQLEQGGTESELAAVLRDVFGSEKRE